MLQLRVRGTERKYNDAFLFLLLSLESYRAVKGDMPVESLSTFQNMD